MLIKKAKIKLVFCILAVQFLMGCQMNQKEEHYILETETETLAESEEVYREDTGGSIYVQVCGAVECPGVVALPAGTRVFEAIQKAGGLREDAEEKSVNQAEVLTDGQQVIILTKEEMQEQVIVANSNDQQVLSEQKINLNTATLQELTALRGIGETRAADIIAYRETNGGFGSIEEIKNISGIKDAVFEKIKDQIKVS